MRWTRHAWALACCVLGSWPAACSRSGFSASGDARTARDARLSDAQGHADGARDDGSPWLRDGGAVDSSPDDFAFTNLIDQPLGSIVLSNAPAITGFSGTLVASVTGGGSPALRVENGVWGPTALLRPGETLQLRVTSSPAVLTTTVAVVSVGTAQVNWSVRTKSGSTRIFTTVGTFTGNMGGLGSAHANCQREAARLGYGGIFRALLSTQAIAAAEVLSSITYPVVRASDGGLVDAGNLWDGNLLGAVTPATGEVWTWTGGLGNAPAAGPSETCNDWRSTGDSGRVGAAQSLDQGWLRYAWQSSCSSSFGLYCVEQPRALGAMLTVTPRAATMLVAEAGAPAYGKSVTFTVENVGDETSVPITTSVSNGTNFELTANDCAGASLDSGMICTVAVRPRAWNGGVFSATLDVNAATLTRVTLTMVAGTLVFRTATAMGGNLGGLAGADAVCAGAAAVAGLAGVFKAVLSDSTVNAADRLSIRYPVITTNGKVIAGNNFWTQSPENGGASSGSSGGYFWSGTNPGGGKNGDTCRDWTSDANSDYGKLGETTGGGCSGGSIFNCQPSPCVSARGLLCMGQ